ncbi:MAG: FAD-dependent oxidoreductase, partial [Novosphingobium sp.]
MADCDYDLFVIGAGSGGVRAARLTALDGKRVAVAEEYRVGGTCVIRGCVPKKFMVMASEVSHALQIAEGYGWSFDQARFDWPTFLEAKDVDERRPVPRGASMFWPDDAKNDVRAFDREGLALLLAHAPTEIPAPTSGEGNDAEPA